MLRRCGKHVELSPGGPVGSLQPDPLALPTLRLDPQGNDTGKVNLIEKRSRAIYRRSTAYCAYPR